MKDVAFCISTSIFRKRLYHQLGIRIPANKYTPTVNSKAFELDLIGYTSIFISKTHDFGWSYFSVGTTYVPIHTRYTVCRKLLKEFEKIPERKKKRFSKKKHFLDRTDSQGEREFL